MLPLVAHADEDDNVPLSQDTLRAQRITFGVIGALVVAGIVFYLFRRWQTIKSGNSVDGSYRDDD